MKKLLSLLIVLTIIGTAVPTTIAASLYQKEKNNYINYQEKNNLENLNKIKGGADIIDSFLQIVIETSGNFKSSGIALNNNIYFGSDDGKVCEYDPATGQQKVVFKAGGQIISSGLVLNNKLYFCAVSSDCVYQYEILDLTDKKIINMKEQIKRGFYLYYNRKEHPNYMPR